MKSSAATKRPEFSPARFWAVVVKEFVQMRRDRLTFGMMVGIPLLQLVLFGFAINVDPKHLPAAVLLADNGPYGRTLLHSIRNCSYLDFVRELKSESEANEALDRGEVQFVINIPENFTRDLLRGDRPAILIEADATDPAATSNAIGSLRTLLNTALLNDLKGPTELLTGSSGPVDLRIHARYNPESITSYNIVPGLMGVVLAMTMTVVTGLAITRERERGTMENLLSMPTRPLEVMTGKIIPYILVGYIQVVLILVASYILFDIPMVGSLWLLFAVSLLFIIANLAVGITFSTVATNQLQAVQMGYFFFLPSLLLSGFMFPFRGMPIWAQMVGEIFPLTHFLRIARGILLKGNGLRDIIPQLWQIVLFIAVAMTLAVKRYRRTLD
jgi:ABC-2 type transport system permease protein